MTSSSTLVIGCSEQLPNELRAYRVMGTSSEGSILLSRHGATYSAAASEVSSYPDLLERMLGAVLPSFPPSLRTPARLALTSQWNRDWGVEAEDLGDRYGGSANDNGAGLVTESPGSSTSPFGASRPTIEGDGSFAAQAALAGRERSSAHG
jgi:hypothetical protein